MTTTIGLLVMAYGTPYKKSDIEPYYTDIRRGRKPSQEELDDLTQRYEAIGGLSPLAGTTERQGEELVTALNESGLYKDVEFKLYIGLKHIHPFIEDTVAQMHQDGITEAVTVVLAPHYSKFSIGSYNKRAKDKADEYGMILHHVNSYFEQPKFIDYWSMRINEVLENIPTDEHKETMLVVSAHSLPEKMIVESHDPYPEQISKTARLIAEHIPLKQISVGWQSAGNTGMPWLEPDVQDLTRELHGLLGSKHFIYTPVGFVAEHLEVLYDNDYECKVVCDEVGATYHRPPMPDTHPLFIGAIVDEISNIYKKA
ncbi:MULTISPECIES: ferrochelatase [unclassified Staphylococcus]|uniref:ferrochelatase n=1 Tax=unclassified Staphylococcus TaxID=91994 RepID=UPI0021CF6A14|nr:MULTISPECIES: ferrochelatase [unclassified Staphylococcus]UXR68922.1 ferrochelatase [Staphylococcus sp. IVB6246]UXR70979.1 ferrochelatase [Staphylococcus sp. IVB6240]UXR73207.1 ferrochelatase [Staphylococcus sp. IVB6238]UXR75505.1 ferrochelatase [Staphylococcus sp. IVB6233]UXR79707.1 ferrochelatase [Staphylococcus sp. IVB6218]